MNYQLYLLSLSNKMLQILFDLSNRLGKKKVSFLLAPKLFK